MPRPLLIFSVLMTLLIGCSPARYRPSITSAPASPSALDCALAYASQAGYRVRSASSSEFFDAVRSERNGYVGALNVTYAEGSLTIVASHEVLSNGHAYAHAPRSSTRNDAEAILQRCGS